MTDQRSAEAQAYRRWYKTKRWQDLRWSILLRDNFTCQMCGKLDASKHALHCDHIEKHGGDEAKFWGGPFQTLCAHCHNAHKQSQERSGRERHAIGTDGWPIDQ